MRRKLTEKESDIFDILDCLPIHNFDFIDSCRDWAFERPLTPKQLTALINIIKKYDKDGEYAEYYED